MPKRKMTVAEEQAYNELAKAAANLRRVQAGDLPVNRTGWDMIKAIPSPDEVRRCLAEGIRETDILRRLLKLSQCVEEECNERWREIQGRGEGE